MGSVTGDSSPFKMVMDNQLTLVARYSPGKLDVRAYGLSRQDEIIPTEGFLHPDLARLIPDHWETPMVDLWQRDTAQSVNCSSHQSQTVSLSTSMICP